MTFVRCQAWFILSLKVYPEKRNIQQVNQCTYSIITESHQKNEMHGSYSMCSMFSAQDKSLFRIISYHASYLKYITWHLLFIFLYYSSPLTSDSNIHSHINKRLICPCVLFGKILLNKWTDIHKWV